MRRIPNCPACGAPVSAGAASCPTCGHALDRGRLAAAARAADRRSSRAIRVVRPWADIARRSLIAALVVALAAGIAMATLGLVTVDRAQDDAAEWEAEAPRRLAQLAEGWPAVEEAARRAAAPIRRGIEDRDAFRELLAGAMLPQSVTRAQRMVASFDVDTTAWTRYGVPAPSTLASQTHVAHGIRSDLPVRLDEETRQRFVAHASSPWLAVWRRAAVAAEPPAAWQYRVGAPGVPGPLELPTLGIEFYQRLARTNEEAALLELERRRRGDDVIAVQRARENVAMALVVARSPHMNEHIAGVMALEESAVLLRFAGERTGDSVAVADARTLRSALDRIRAVSFSVAPRSVDADSAVQRATVLAGDRRLPPAVRWSAPAEILIASCLRTRDVVLGPAPAARESLRETATRLADLDPETRLRPAIERAGAEWEALTQGGGWRRSRLHPPTWPTMLESVGLGGLAGRVMLCGER